MSSYSRVAVVTGGNKGIGYAIVRHLSLEYPTSQLNNGKLLIYLTARSKERGEAAVQALHADVELAKAKALTAAGGRTDVQFHALDVTEARSIQAFRQHLSSTHPDGIDLAINNAGIAADGFDAAIVDKVLATNYYGALHMSEAFLEHLRPGGRLINIASQLGRIGRYPAALQTAFHDAAAQSTPAATTALMADFAAAVASNTLSQRGWPRSAYSVSKAGCIAMSMALARAEAARGRGIAINACCPGYVRTDLTGGRGFGSPDDGARTPVFLALKEPSGVSGEFWQRERVSEW